MVKRIAVCVLSVCLLLSTVFWLALPALAALTVGTETTAVDDQKYVPIKDAAHNVSSGMEVTANLASGDRLSNLNDGILNSHASTQAGTAENPGWLQIDLGEVLPLEEIFVLCYNADNRYYHYDIYVSEDGDAFTLFAQKADDISDKTSGGNWFYAGNTKARYVRVVYVFNSKNNGFHLCEVQVYAKNGNLWQYLNKQIAAVPSMTIYYSDKLSLTEWLKEKKAELSAVDAELPTLAVLQEEVEAKIAAYALPQRNENCLVSLGKAVAFESAESETVNKINNGIAEDFASIEVNGWIQIDLGEALPLEEVYVLCYSADARYYHYKIYTSADGVDFTLLADKNDAVSDKVSGGNRFCANGVQARYVRIVGTLNSMSVSNPDNSDIHVKEMQVYTTAADYGAVDEARGKVPADLSIYTSETVQMLNDALAAVTAGKNATEQATVDDYAKAINDALAALILKDADYSAVNTAKSKMPTDLSLYTDASANAVIAACNAVVTGKKITEQSVVDGYAAAIEAAIMALVPKQTEKNEEQAKEQIKEEADREEDTFSVPIIVSVSVCAVGAAGVVSFTILRKRGHLGK